MFPDPKIKCPATGFARSCREIIAECDCPKFVKIIGVNPNDGQPVDKLGCIDSFLHMLLIENTLMQRQTGAAVESFRNEMIKANHASLIALAATQIEMQKASEIKQAWPDASKASAVLIGGDRIVADGRHSE